MNRLLILGMVAAIGVSAQAASITVKNAAQRYPWNGLVDIDYEIQLGTGEILSDANDAVEFSVTDNASGAVYRPVTFRIVPLPLAAGTHRVTWDANADGVTFKSSDVTVSAKIVSYSEAYMVVDVSGGSNAAYFPVDYLNGKPTGGFLNGTYRGDKIVLRRIRPGSYVAGSPADELERSSRETQHNVILTNAFYIGIFEVTQKQYKNVTGKDPAADKGDFRPVDGVTYADLRGNNLGAKWPQHSRVDATSFMGILRAKCKSRDTDGNYTVPVEGFDLPTEFQWEYACRAGTTTMYNDGVAHTTKADAENALNTLARWRLTRNDGKGDASYVTTTTVGSYAPNAFGLYDMHGNVWEWCLDWYFDDRSTLGQVVEPVGNSMGSYRCRRGGSCEVYGTTSLSYPMFTSAYHLSHAGYPGSPSSFNGFRLCHRMPLP